jgi:hypothetical protein
MMPTSPNTGFGGGLELGGAVSQALETEVCVSPAHGLHVNAPGENTPLSLPNIKSWKDHLQQKKQLLKALQSGEKDAQHLLEGEDGEGTPKKSRVSSSSSENSIIRKMHIH